METENGPLAQVFTLDRCALKTWYFNNKVIQYVCCIELGVVITYIRIVRYTCNKFLLQYPPSCKATPFKGHPVNQIRF